MLSRRGLSDDAVGPDRRTPAPIVIDASPRRGPADARRRPTRCPDGHDLHRRPPDRRDRSRSRRPPARRRDRAAVPRAAHRRRAGPPGASGCGGPLAGLGVRARRRRRAWPCSARRCSPSTTSRSRARCTPTRTRLAAVVDDLDGHARAARRHRRGRARRSRRSRGSRTPGCTPTSRTAPRSRSASASPVATFEGPDGALPGHRRRRPGARRARRPAGRLPARAQRRPAVERGRASSPRRASAPRPAWSRR